MKFLNIWDSDLFRLPPSRAGGQGVSIFEFRIYNALPKLDRINRIFRISFFKKNQVDNDWYLETLLRYCGTL